MKSSQTFHFGLRVLLAVLFFNFSAAFSVKASAVFTDLLEGVETPEGNQLTWSTSSETNSVFFIIEKSVDGISFNTVATLPATSSADRERTYHYLDKQSKDLRVFYRLVEITEDGRGLFSHAVVISKKSERAKFNLRQVDAIATHTDFKAIIDCKTAGIFNYRIMTNLGDILGEGDIVVKAGSNDISIPTTDLTVGTYQLALKLENDIELFKLKKVDSPDVPTVEFARKY